MNKILFILFFIQILACNQNRDDSILLRIGATDSCYKLADSYMRQIEIVENTLEDTMVLGYAILLPKYTGEFTYYRGDGTGDAVFDPKTPAHLLPKTKMICLGLYQKRKTGGYIVVKLNK